MSIDEGKEEAAELGKRAARQAGHAGRNAGRAVAAVAEPIGEEIEERAEQAAEAALEKTRGFGSRALAAFSGNTGQGVMALSVAIWAGSVAFQKFAMAYAERGRGVN